LETDHCIYLTVLFVLKIKSRRHFKTFKINYKNEFFFSNNLISQNSKKSLIPETNNLISTFLGKTVILEGSIIKTKKKIIRVSAILIECEKCGSIFYFILDTLNQFLPFLCSKANCISKNFYSYFTRFVGENFQKVKIGGISINFKKLKSTESFILNIFGNKEITEIHGQKIFCEAHIKLHPIFKRSFSFFEKKLFFGIYFESRYLQNSLKFQLKYKDNCFLTKKEFCLIHRLVSIFDLFQLFIKNLRPVCTKNEGLKACLILLMSQQKTNSKNIRRNDLMYSFLFVSINLVSEISFLKELSKSFPRSFFFSFNDFNTYFNSKFSKGSVKSRKKNFKFRNSVFFINILPGKKGPYNFSSNIKLILKTLKKNSWILKNSLFVFFMKIKKEEKRSLKYFNEFSDETTKNFKTNHLLYIIRKNNIEINEKIEALEILKYQTKKKISNTKQNQIINELNRLSIFKHLIFKKRISRLFFKKYLNFVQNFPNSRLTNSSFELLLFFYKKIKNLKTGYLMSSSNFLIVIQKLCQCRAKIDLRDRVHWSDVFDGLEIFFDSKPKFLKKLKSELTLISNKTLKKLSLTQKLLNLLQKFFYRSGQTLFELNRLKKNFNNEAGFFEVMKILKVVKMVRELKKNLIIINV
jgi:DNA replicative helicase MCM subunit Mcm2 (Cdc46/Mcm family)